MDAGADPNISDGEGLNILRHKHNKQRTRWVFIYLFILKIGIPPLFHVCSQGNGSGLRLFLSKKLNPSVLDKNGRNGLFYAVLPGNTTVLLGLLRNGSNFNFSFPFNS